MAFQAKELYQYKESVRYASVSNRVAKVLKKNWQLYLYMLLPMLYLIIFAYGPMFGIVIAFKDFSPQHGIWGSKWVGLKNFNEFLNSYQFIQVLKNTLLISVYSLFVSFPIPIILALIINVIRNETFKKATQMIVYIPHFISTVVLVGMIHQIFNPIIGLYGNLYTRITGKAAFDIMTKPETFLHMYVWSGVWQNMGWNSIIYIAALSSVSNELHEAAQIDGASRFKRILHIDLPSILPTAVTLLILNCGHIMSVGFEKVFLMQNPLNLKYSEVISTYVYKIGIASGGGDFSYSTAIGLFNSVINFILILTVNAISKKISETSLW